MKLLRTLWAVILALLFGFATQAQQVFNNLRVTNLTVVNINTVDAQSVITNSAAAKLDITNGTAVNLSASGTLTPTSSATRTFSTDADTLYTLGDSFTYGAGATSYTNTYASKFAASLGLSALNIANGSFSIADANWIAFPGWTVTNSTGPSSYTFSSPSAITEDHNFTALIGFNDLRTGSGTGTAPSAARYRLGLDHLIHYLAIPDSAKRWAVSPDASTGTWTESPWTQYTDKAAESSSGTLTFSNVIGSEIYIGYLAWATNYGGSLQITVDGVSQTTIATASAAYGNREYINGSDPVIPDHDGPYGNGKIDFCPHLYRVTGLGLGAHTVVLTASANPTTVIWVAGNGWKRTLREGPNVWLGAIPRQSPWTGAGTDALHAAYNAQLRASVAAARIGGLRVSIAPVGEYYNPAAEQSVDGVHPDNTGHTTIASAFEQAMTGDVYALSGRGFAPPEIASGVVVGSGSTASKTGTVRLSSGDALVWRDSNGFDGVNLSNAANGLTITAPNTSGSILREFAFNGAAYPFASFTYANSAAGSPVMFNQNGSAGLSSGTYIMDRLQATINQSGTAGYSLLKVDVTETASGSGDRNAFEVTLGGTQTVRILPTGRLLLNSQTAGTSTSTRLGRGSAANSTFLFTYDDSTQDIQHEFYGSSWTWKTNSTQTAGGAFSLGPTEGTLTINPTTTLANSIRLASLGSDPSSPSDGSIWYRFDTDVMKLRANSATVDVATKPATETLAYSSTTVTLTAGKGPNQSSVLTCTNNFTLTFSGVTDNDGGTIWVHPAATNCTVTLSSPAYGPSGTTLTITGGTGSTNHTVLAWKATTVNSTNVVNINALNYYR